MTQAQLAREINSTKVQVSRYENGVIFPVFETIIKLSIVLDVSLDYLAGRTENRLGGNVPLFSDLTHDEQELIQGLRENDMKTSLVAMSLCLDTSPARSRQRFELGKDAAQMFKHGRSACPRTGC